MRLGNAQVVADAVDIIQIPAFLCRQTDLLVAAGQTGAVVNVKKGQFLAPWDMAHVAAKVAATGQRQHPVDRARHVRLAITRWSPICGVCRKWRRSGYPVVMDATHSVQQPGGAGGASGGQREFAPVMARAAVSLGIAAVFIETHDDPDSAPSDGPNMIPLDQMAPLIEGLAKLDAWAKADPIRI